MMVEAAGAWVPVVRKKKQQRQRGGKKDRERERGGERKEKTRG